MSSQNKAYVFSIGEPTTDLCVWSLERQGFDVTVYRDGTSLAQKLKRLYNEATEDFVRVDADVICNTKVSTSFRELWKIKPEYVLWYQGKTFDWYKMEDMHGGVQFIDHKALPYLRDNIDRFMNDPRPETRVSRIAELHDPRKVLNLEAIFGIHGFKQNDLDRVKRMKQERGQYELYDWDLMEAVNKL